MEEMTVKRKTRGKRKNVCCVCAVQCAKELTYFNRCISAQIHSLIGQTVERVLEVLPTSGNTNQSIH